MKKAIGILVCFSILFCGCNSHNNTTITAIPNVDVNNGVEVDADVGIANTDVKATIIENNETNISEQNITNINIEATNYYVGDTKYDIDSQEFEFTTNSEPEVVSSEITTDLFVADTSTLTENNTILSAYDSTDGYSQLSVENVINIAGKNYDEGLSFNIGASYNIWGSGKQYALFNITDIANSHNTISFEIGRVSNYGLEDIILNIYTCGQNEDYGEPETYRIKSDCMLTNISVNIVGKTSMKIEVNATGSGTRYGIVNIMLE